MFSMEQLKYSYKFNLTDTKKVEDCPSFGVYLTILHANKIPPHIGLLIDGYFFSLKAKGKDVKIPATWLINSIKKKKIATIFIEMERSKTLYLEHVYDYFTALPNGIPENQTCLTPILSLLDAPNDCDCVADLLVYLADKNKIKNEWWMNLPASFEQLPFYGKEEIQQRIKDLKHV